MSERPIALALAERVAEVARGLNIETAVIGAVALAVHNYVRATLDVDLATAVDPYTDLRRLEEALRACGYHVKRNLPDDEDQLGGLVRVWTDEDEDGEPLEPVEVVNFVNPHRPRRAPGRDAIERAFPLEGSSLRCVGLVDLIAIKLDAGGFKDLGDAVELLRRNADADIEAVRATCKAYGLDRIDELIAEARTPPGR